MLSCYVEVGIDADVLSGDAPGYAAAKCVRKAGSCTQRAEHADADTQVFIEGSASVLQDWLDIDFAIKEDVDFIAVSFVKSADVIKNLKSYLNARATKVCAPGQPRFASEGPLD